MNIIRSIDKRVTAIAMMSVLVIVCSDLWWVELPELFNGGSELLTSMYNVSLGYFVSYIFYVLVVHLPEYKKKQHINSVITPVVKRIIESHAKVKRAEKILSHNGSSFIDLDAIVPDEIDFEPQNTIWQRFLLVSLEYVEHNLVVLEKFYPHLDAQFIENCESVRNTELLLALKCIDVMNDTDKRYNHIRLQEMYDNYNDKLMQIRVP